MVKLPMGFLLAAAVFIGCSDRTDSPSPPAPYSPTADVLDAPAEVETEITAEITAEVETAVWAFHAADTAKNAEAVISLLWPEFYMLADGARLEYDDVVEGSRGFLPNLEVFATDWTDVRITPLGPNHAVSSFLFRDSIVTSAGELIQARGPTTFIWEKRNGEWRALYADADHYPLDP